MTEREQFEHEMRKIGWSVGLQTWEQEHNGYLNPVVQRMWEGWKLAAAHYKGMAKTLGDGFARVLEDE